MIEQEGKERRGEENKKEEKKKKKKEREKKEQKQNDYTMCNQWWVLGKIMGVRGVITQCVINGG